MQEVDTGEAHLALHQVTITYHDLARKAGRDDRQYSVKRTERVNPVTEGDDTVQMLTIPMLVSEGYMSWQEGNQLMKTCSPKENDRLSRVGQSLIIKNHQMPHRTLQQYQVMLPERSQGLSRLLTVHWRRNSKPIHFCSKQVRWQRSTPT